MLRSGLLRCSLLFALGTIGIWANEDVGGDPVSASLKVAQVPRRGEPFLWNNYERAVVEKENTVERLIVERIPDSIRKSPREQAAPTLRIPEPTTPPQKRQDDGQVQALSSQLQSLSQSATQALSSVSSSASSAMSLVSQSAQSVRQSADQAVRSANQNADDANRQLSQTRSSASSAVSAATARASDDLSRSLSSMSSRISSNLASAQSSASNAVSSAKAEASSSAANAVNIAASQIQEARADASGVRGDANSIVTQVQGNSISATNVAIIVTASVIGTAILTTIVSCFIVRYRRKKKYTREELATAINTNNEKQYERPFEKPIAVRGTPNSPRFTPGGGGTGYPMDKFKLPDLTLSPFLRKKTGTEASPSDIGFARSSNSPKGAVTSAPAPNTNDVYGVSPTSFRLQKENSIKSATSVRLIRVGSSNKGKTKAVEDDQRALLSPIASPALPTPVPPVSTAPAAVVIPPQPQPRVQSIPPQSLVEIQIAEPVPIATRSTRNTEPEELTIEPRKRSGTMTSQQRLRFRDSSDVESAEPSPATSSLTSMRNTNTASLRNGGVSPPRRPKNAGASFATFPRVRDGPPRGSAAEAIMNRSRAGLSGVTARLREEAERRRRETLEMGGGRRSSKSEAYAAAETKEPNWPFGNA
ncbi:uncharacterized protein F4822DRAFT_429491 [Hypoxylon trugodes]|uniref:uncharacterized protein n=1 Tax=Hypoxylon trugodes TaxID=326681 RepID=UPI002193422D|nr:uncharacterized protein F4822DRAFT_429491 [Hypoxylon trugodes]KAI1388874.1 hypothetical protein F4822DRAFT_429491 [Hypoxylon trugodes]